MKINWFENAVFQKQDFHNVSPHKKTQQFTFRKKQILASQKPPAAFAAVTAVRGQSRAVPPRDLPDGGGGCASARSHPCRAWGATGFGFCASAPEGTTRGDRREGNRHPGVLGHGQAIPRLLPGLPPNVITKIKVQSAKYWSLAPVRGSVSSCGAGVRPGAGKTQVLGTAFPEEP